MKCFHGKGAKSVTISMHSSDHIKGNRLGKEEEAPGTMVASHLSVNRT